MTRKSWTKEEIEFLKTSINNYKTPDYIAKKLNRTKNSIVIKANRLNLNFKGKRRVLTSDELNKIKKDWLNNTITIQQIAKKYHKSVIAITIIAQRHKFGPRGINPDDMSINDICECVGISRDIVKSWMQKGLKYTKQRIGKSTYHIELDDLLDFMQKHPKAYDARYVDTCIFPYELPDWFKEKSKQDYISKREKRKIYTEIDNKIILKDLKNDINIRIIAKKLKRTLPSLRRHIYRLKNHH